MTAEELSPQEVVVVITDAFEGAGVTRWEALITEAAELRPRRLIVDLSASPSIDAAAIVVLLQVHRQLVCADGQLTLRGPVPGVRHMLGLARLDHVLDVRPGADETPDAIALTPAR